MSERKGVGGAVALLVLILVGVAAWLVLNSPVFAVRTIRVVGNSILSAGDVTRLAGVLEGDNLFRLSASDVERRLLRSPWIAAAEIERRWPSTLALRIVERRVVALAEDGEGPVTVAADGTVLARVQRSVLHGPVAVTGSLGYPYLPKVSGDLAPGSPYPGPAGPLQLAASFSQALRREVTRISIEGDHVRLRLRGGGVVLYGALSGVEAKNVALLSLIRKAGSRHIEVGYIDVRIPSSPALKPAA